METGRSRERHQSSAASRQCNDFLAARRAQRADRGAIRKNPAPTGQTIRRCWKSRTRSPNSTASLPRKSKQSKPPIRRLTKLPLAQEQELKKQLETTRTETLDTQKRSIQYNILKREVDTTRALYESLLQRFKEVDVASGVGVNNVFVIDRAGLPGGPSYPVRSTFLRNALLAGLAVGLALSYLLERLDDVVHTSDEAERLSSLTTLGIIPKAKNLQTEMADARSGLSEAYRSLATTLQLSTAEGLPKALLITSSTPGEGKSLTCLMIAKQFAATGLRVLLIDADLRNASLHKKLNLDNSLGLSNYLTSGCTPSEAVQRVGDKQQFFFMSSGPLPPNSAELLGSPRMHYLIDVTTRTFDLVIVDGPPVMGLADTPLLTRAVKATVLVVAAGQTRRPALQSALKRLMLARTNIIGLILTKFDSKLAGYGHGYGYGDAYGYGGAGYGQIAQQNPGALKSDGNEKLEEAAIEANGGDVVDEPGANKPERRRSGWAKLISRFTDRVMGTSTKRSVT